jgi:transcriptional regulator with XRE-family HTH domain
MLSSRIATIAAMQQEAQDFSLLSNRVRHALDIAGLTPADVARELPVSRPAVDQWILGTTKNIKNELLFALADLCGVSPRWLGTGQGAVIDAYQKNKEVKRVLAVMEELPSYAREQAVAEVEAIARLIKRATDADAAD